MRARKYKKRLAECFECHQIRPMQGHGLCSRCHPKWRRKHLKGRCAYCRDGRVKPLTIVSPPKCTACYAKEVYRRNKARDPEGMRAKSRFYSRQQRERPGVRARQAAVVRGKYASDPAYREKKKQASAARYAHLMATMSPEEREAYNASRRAARRRSDDRRRKRQHIARLMRLLLDRAEANRWSTFGAVAAPVATFNAAALPEGRESELAKLRRLTRLDGQFSFGSLRGRAKQPQSPTMPADAPVATFAPAPEVRVPKPKTKDHQRRALRYYKPTG